MPSPPTMAVMRMSQSTTARIRATILAFEVLCIPPTAGLPSTKQLIVSPVASKTKERFRFATVDAQDTIVGSVERSYWASFENQPFVVSVSSILNQTDVGFLPTWASSPLKG